MYSVPGDTTSLVPGFPIRTSSDQRSVDSSPRHIAASHVLHRLPVPRHPPCALKHLQHKKPKIENHKKLHHNKPHTPAQSRNPGTRTMRLDARNHYPQIKHHTPPPSRATTTTPHHHPPPVSDPGRPALPHPARVGAAGPVASGPNSVSGGAPRRNPAGEPVQSRTHRLSRTHPEPTTGIQVESPNHHESHRRGDGGTISVSVLLRKEVIQPHLPVRLPCYDFVPIADPTFDGSLHKG